MKHLSSVDSCTLTGVVAFRSGRVDIWRITTHRSLRYLVPLFLTAALGAPVAIMAVPVSQEAHDQNRVHDKDHKDYHEWNDNEIAPGGTTLRKTITNLTSSPRQTRAATAILELAPFPSK